MPGLEHEMLVGRLMEKGWRDRGLPGWLRAAADHRSRNEMGSTGLRSELVELATIYRDDCRFLPDAWKVTIEGKAQGWGHRVLVFDFCEAIVSNRMGTRKFSSYLYFMSTIDCLEYVGARLWCWIAGNSEPHLYLDEEQAFWHEAEMAKL